MTALSKKSGSSKPGTRLRKRTALVLSLLLAATHVPVTGGAWTTQVSAQSTLVNQLEEKSHWAAPVLQKWHNEGLLTGYPDGSLRPDQVITRAELVKLLHTMFGFNEQGSASFHDVKAEQWFAAAVSAVEAAGYVRGYPDGSFRPSQAVTREQAAHVLAGLFSLNATADTSLTGYKDAGDVSKYAQESTAKLAASGILQGYPDGTLRPRTPLTRAELVSLLERLAPRMMKQGETLTGETVKGNLLVRAAGAVIRNTIVNGNVFLAAGIGEGDASLEQTTVKGTLFVHGGGSNSIYLADSSVEELQLNKQEGPVRIVISGASEIGRVDVQTPAVIEVEEGASIEVIHIHSGAAGTTITGKGQIREITNEGDEVTLNGKTLGRGKTEPVGGVAPQTPGGTPQTPAAPGSGGGTPQIPSVPNPGSGNPQPEPGDESDWTLVWSDEFDGTGSNLDVNGVNLDLWDYQLGTGAEYGLDGWGNNEQQYYRAENAKVENGSLIIEARNDGYGGKPYTSSRLYTQPTFTKKYGRFEARMKLPVGSGFWPAFWMMPADNRYGGWAASGEIDIMEARGRLPGEVGGTIHYGESWPLNRSTGAEYHFPEGTDISDFHTYAVEWEPGVLRWYVDGELYQELTNWDSWGKNMPAKYAFPAPFDQEFYLILNLAVGGNYDGGRNPDASLLPSTMEVDYVRVYELTGRPYNTPVEPQVLAEPLPEGAKEAVNGNYVHDMLYEQPIKEVAADGEALSPDYWNFVHISTFGGNGTAAVELLDGIPFAKLGITAAGNAAHAVQLIQHVSLGKGRWYKLSFDAKAGADRTMAVKLGGGADRGWGAYSRTLEAQLSPELQRYELVFQMEKETDLNARLEFNAGLNMSSVWIGNVKLEESNAPALYPDEPKPPVNDNYIYNGTFDLGRIDRMTFWHLMTDGAAATAAVDPAARELKAAITDGGASETAVKLVQPGVRLVGGSSYKLSFDARADQERTIQAALWNKEGTVIYAAPQAIELTEQMEIKTVTFEMQAPSDEEGQLVFLLGGRAGDVYLDNVSLTREGNSANELSLDEQFPLKNGSFSRGTANWSEHVQGRWDGWDQQTRYSVEDGELKFHISSAGNQPWDVMLMQTDFPLRSGSTYVVSMDARSTMDRPVELVIETGQQRYLEETVQLTDSMQHFSFELPVNDDLEVSFRLLMGKLAGLQSGSHDIYVDNIRVEQKGARDQAFLAVNGDFSDGLTGWGTHLQGQYDGPSSASFQEDAGEARVSINHAGINPWDIILMQTNKSLKQGQTYLVSFKARSTSPRAIEAVIDNHEYTRFLNETIDLTSEMQIFSFEVTLESDQNAGLKFLMGAAPGIGADRHDIYIDDVQMELKGAREAISGATVAP
ncbi:carbohydrate binding domain-containing protein [Paenibacillus algicola]|nr:carbohydrate binding domain-containing protein [Paenibacillus algicola]